MKPREKKRLLFYILLPVLGALFLALYIYMAGADVVYSDYIRIIDEYLPDVSDIGRVLVPDILTRIPLCFAQRLINVQSFSYSVTFDRVCTVFGILMMAWVLCRFAVRQKLKAYMYAAVMTVLFSLLKWEILMNGTCWAHMAAIGLFFINYRVFDDIWQGESDALEELICCLMPFMWLLVAGEYIASYAVTMILISLFGALTGGAVNIGSRRVQKVFVRITICTALALFLYMWSRSYAVWEHSGAADMTLAGLIRYAPGFLPRFFLKSLAGTVIGSEEVLSFIGGKPLPDTVVFAAGTVVLLAYIMAFVLYFKNGMNERTVFPLILLISGFINHGVVTAGRWIFLNENYGLSSRYAGQFMIGTIGILLIFGLVRRNAGYYRRRENRDLKVAARVFMIFSVVLILTGSIYTSARELQKAKYRKSNYEHMAEVIRDYGSYGDEELCAVLEWHKDPEVLKNALKILKDNSLNVFSPMSGTGLYAEKEEAA